MKSYKNLYRRLPNEFIERISAQYGDRELDRMFNGFMSNRSVTVRVNTLKTNVRQVMTVFRRDNIKFDRVLWYEDALIIKNQREKHLEKHDLYKAGHIYLQSLSSMIPPLILNPKPGWKILDMTAAPGSKSTQLAAMMGNLGVIHANEINPIRAERLSFNIAHQGADIIEMRIGDGKKLHGQWEGYFDAVLLDAPCSGIGLFSVDNSQTYRHWSQKLVNKLAREQKKLLTKALWALKPEGVLVYSTCTLAREENEENVNWFLENFGHQVRLEKIGLKLTSVQTAKPLSSVQKYRDYMLLILPSDLFEGFFITKFKKLV